MNIQKELEQLKVDREVDAHNESHEFRLGYVKAMCHAINLVKNLNLSDVTDRFIEAVNDIDSNGLGCGIEDVGITDRYEAMEYGFEQCKERALEAIALAAE